MVFCFGWLIIIMVMRRLFLFITKYFIKHKSLLYFLNVPTNFHIMTQQLNKFLILFTSCTLANKLTKVTMLHAHSFLIRNSTRATPISPTAEFLIFISLNMILYIWMLKHSLTIIIRIKELMIDKLIKKPLWRH